MFIVLNKKKCKKGKTLEILSLLSKQADNNSWVIKSLDKCLKLQFLVAGSKNIRLYRSWESHNFWLLILKITNYSRKWISYVYLLVWLKLDFIGWSKIEVPHQAKCVLLTATVLDVWPSLCRKMYVQNLILGGCSVHIAHNGLFSEAVKLGNKKD